MVLTSGQNAMSGLIQGHCLIIGRAGPDVYGSSVVVCVCVCVVVCVLFLFVFLFLMGGVGTLNEGETELNSKIVSVPYRFT